MDARDLPTPVAKAVLEYDGPWCASFLRLEAATRVQAAVGPLWQAGEWAAVIELLALAQGFLTAALRAEEEREAA